MDGSIEHGAARQLHANFEKVVEAISSATFTNIGGNAGGLVPVACRTHVRTMVTAVCCRLLGKEPARASTPQEAIVWKRSARYLGKLARLYVQPSHASAIEWAALAQLQAAAASWRDGDVSRRPKKTLGKKRVPPPQEFAANRRARRKADRHGNRQRLS